MRWRDIRFELPTKADADEFGMVLGLYGDGSKRTCYMGCTKTLVAWAPISELPAFDPIPDPPEGWRFVQDGEAFDFRCQVWDASVNQYRPRNYPRLPLTPGNTYIVPIDPPAPQYRPFANAAEFEPHKNCWWRYKSMGDDEQVPPALFNDKIHGTQYWADAFTNKEFADGTPFGVRIDQ
jgi:hypothetical protein